MIHFLLLKQYANWNNIKQEMLRVYYFLIKPLGNLNIKIHFSQLKECPTILINVNKCKAKSIYNCTLKVIEKVVQQANVPSPDQTNIIKK